MSLSVSRLAATQYDYGSSVISPKRESIMPVNLKRDSQNANSGLLKLVNKISHRHFWLYT
jgi:hypothetical protein